MIKTTCIHSSVPDLPLFAHERLQKRTAVICGTTRPLAAFSLLEAVLFQRTFLRTLEQVWP